MEQKDLTFIVVGPMVWGRGKTVTEARQNLRKSSGKTATSYFVYVVEDPEATVDGMGRIVQKAGSKPPMLIQQFKDRKELPLSASVA